MAQSRTTLLFFLTILLIFSSPTTAEENLFGSGKILATPGVIQVEGTAGGGLTPWAVISGYGTNRQIGGSVHHTYVTTNDFTLNATGATVGLYDRLELSFTRQWFDTGSAGERLGLGEGFKFNQDILGAKVKIFGDAVYDQDTWMPQVALGAQYKKVDKGAIVRAVGAEDDDDIDVYLAATKILLDKSLVLTGTARLTRANQFGLLGFGGPNGSSRSLQFEGSVAYLLSRHFVLGADYRTKPDNLAFAEEDDAMAAYVVWLPSKHLTVTAAYTDLGKIALQGRQRGFYLSVQLGF
ncbi:MULTISPECIES: DUF3034 family protein [Kordiimonas]|jgi:hypothetical protein|uniref:DUF3034 family protein n=1 Tax=Kordiimonas TaxID=288021 RepID=UPI00257B70C7|nr:DUF3034 family protein [Kordiimonas sp. UBA4487]